MMMPVFHADGKYPIYKQLFMMLVSRTRDLSGKFFSAKLEILP